MQRRLWRLAGQSLDGQPTDSAPRLYVESLNEMIDMQTTRVSALNNRVPSAFLMVEVIGAAAALGLLALYLAILSRGVVTVLLAAALLDGDPLRQLRPRPARTRVHQGPGGTARRTPRLDGPPSGRPAHPLGPPA